MSDASDNPKASREAQHEMQHGAHEAQHGARGVLRSKPIARQQARPWLVAMLICAVVAFAMLADTAFKGMPQEVSYGEESGEYAWQPGFVGTYKTQADGEERSIVRTTPYDALPGNTLILEGRFATSIPDGEAIQLYLKGISVEMYLNGEQIYSAGSAWSGVSDAHDAISGWVTFVSPGIERTDSVQFVLTKTHSDIGYNYDSFQTFMDNLTSGSTSALAATQIDEHQDQLRLAVALIIAAVALLAAAATLALAHSGFSAHAIAAAVALLASAVVCGADPSFATLMFANIYNVNIAGFIALCALAPAVCALPAINLRRKWLSRLACAWFVVSLAISLAALTAVASGAYDWIEAATTLLLPQQVCCGVACALMLANVALERSVQSVAFLVGALLAAFGTMAQAQTFLLVTRTWALVGAGGAALMVFAVVEFAALLYRARAVRASER